MQRTRKDFMPSLLGEDWFQSRLFFVLCRVIFALCRCWDARSS